MSETDATEDRLQQVMERAAFQTDVDWGDEKIITQKLRAAWQNGEIGPKDFNVGAIDTCELCGQGIGPDAEAEPHGGLAGRTHTECVRRYGEQYAHIRHGTIVAVSVDRDGMGRIDKVETILDTADTIRKDPTDSPS